MILKKVILVINKRNVWYLRVLNHESVYIGISMVMQINDIRIYLIDFDAPTISSPWNIYLISYTGTSTTTTIMNEYQEAYTKYLT